MSVRLETTPWLTKNFAGVRRDTGALLLAAVGTVRMVPQGHARRAPIRATDSGIRTVPGDGASDSRRV